MRFILPLTHGASDGVAIKSLSKMLPFQASKPPVHADELAKAGVIRDETPCSLWRTLDVEYYTFFSILQVIGMAVSREKKRQPPPRACKDNSQT